MANKRSPAREAATARLFARIIADYEATLDEVTWDRWIPSFPRDEYRLFLYAQRNTRDKLCPYQNALRLMGEP